MTILENKKRYYKRNLAVALVFELNSNEPAEEGWRFVARDCLKTLAFIEVYDHENELVGYWDL